MKRKITMYRPESKAYIYHCVGYEGHECGLEVRSGHPLKENQEPRCRSCGVFHRKIYQAEYYQDNKDKAKAYQKDYNERVRKSQIMSEKRKMTTNSTRMVGKRTQIIESFSASHLMNQPPEKIERSINRILNGICDYSGSK